MSLLARPAAGPPAPPRRRWCPATRLLVAAALGWLAVTVAHRALTGRWWLWLLPDLLPPLAYLAVPVGLALGVPAARLLRRPLPARPATAVLAGAAAALALGLPDAGLNRHAFADRPAPPPDALRVLAWNTGYWDQHDDPDAFLRFLADQRADVYLLQEHLYWDDAAGLAGARPAPGLDRLRRAFPGYAVLARGELLTLSRYPVLARPAVGPDAALAADPAADFGRVFAAAKVLRVDLRVGDRTLSTYNVHLPVQVNLAPERFWAYVRERDAARRAQLAALGADLAANPNPALVAGDLNTTPAMGDLRPLRDRLRDAADASVDLYPASWPASGPTWRLDWTLASAQVRVHRYALGDPRGLSDHRTQTALISLEEAR
ncbi:endonuclease/exonuclease/phosphatase family protein [Micromonospora sp. NBC_01655]|uniref:endonuclease/exonuclease/phosphatase family protein n=1 Tax=Micromonospora sp. NBC_01655 TaxID=2975983 RepID=UPI00225703AF|nr:endonuclease/exonuclease/phosphatase family protein [Micromonospora sp. NBC_01655]MCX4473209.1 endonuclease/exonuclease/phosphatase family protein [Micromonospora sp. NBC_01655]